MSYMPQTGPDARYLQVAGGTMTGALTVAAQVANPAASLVVRDDNHPSIKMINTGATAGKGQWRQYVSHTLGEGAPVTGNLTFMPEIDDATDEPAGGVVMHRDGRMEIGGLQVLTTANQEVTTQTTWTPASGWSVVAGASLYATRIGPLVVVEGMVKPNTDQAIAGGTVLTICSALPPGVVPAIPAYGAAMIALNGSYPVALRIHATPAGAIQIRSGDVSGTLSAASGYVAFTLPYRAG